MVEWEEAWGSDFGVGEGEIGGSESVSEIFYNKEGNNVCVCVAYFSLCFISSFQFFSRFS